MEISFVVKGAGAVMLLFRSGYKMSVICHNVNTQNLKIARIDRPHILASHLLHIDIDPVTKIFQGLYTQKIER